MAGQSVYPSYLLESTVQHTIRRSDAAVHADVECSLFKYRDGQCGASGLRILYREFIKR